MLEKRVKIQSVVENQLPIFLGAELEGASDFLKTYYKTVEYQGGPIDILENIDQYRKVGTYTSIVGVTTVTSDVNVEDSTINVGNTAGWPEKYGLLKINDEIISYTGKTNTTFTGCIRGFSGITSYRGNSGPDELIFEDTEAEEHVSADQVENLSSLFLKEFYKKLKTQYLPGLTDTKLTDQLNVSNYLIQGADFYRSKGTSDAFEILFKALYNEKVDVLKPQDDLFAPSDAQYSKILRLNIEPTDQSIDTTDAYLTGFLTKNIFQENEKGEVTASGSVLKSERFVVDGKDFFQVDLDYSEPKDLNVVGSGYGNFKITPQTKVIGNVSVASTFIDVESTIGFPSEGELQVLFSNNDIGIVSYTSKNITQFLNLDGVVNGVLDKQEVFQNIKSYGILSDGSEFEFRIKGSLGTFNIKAPDRATPYFVKDDVIKNQSLGYSKSNIVTDSLLSNETSRFDIKHARILNQNQLGQNPNIISLYQIESEQPHDLSIGDSIQVITTTGLETSGVVNNIVTEFTFDVSGLSGFDPDRGGEVRRLITKVDSQNSVVNNLPANVLKSFYDSNDSVYIASHSLPKYINPIDTKTGNVILTDNGKSSTAPLIISGDTIDYIRHGFFNGDEVYYLPDKFVELVSGYGEPVAITTERTLGDLSEGKYFVKRIDADSFKLAESRSNIITNKFVDVTGIASNQVIFPINSYENQLDSSYGITKVPRFIEVPDKKINTAPGKIGILVNGVDAHSYKSRDYCFYGNLTGIDVLVGGSNYDVINPPNLIISDNIGSGATATTTVVGGLEEIEVDDSGYDFLDEPIIDISGGNGRGAKAKAVLKSEKTFALTDVSVGGGNVSLSDNTIGFTTYHRFRNADAVVYNANSLTPLGNLVSNSIYYVNVRSLNEVTLHGNESTALAGVGTISITSFGEGNHYFTTVNEKKFLSSVTVESSGEGYSSNTIKVSSTGINTSTDQISFIDHGFNTGETIQYRFEGSSISGLTTDQQYLVTRIDDNLFKLSSAGIGTQFSYYNFDNQIFVDFTSVGSASTHIFNYPEINVSIRGNIGIATTNSLTFKPKLKPKFRGSISKINLERGGIAYGSSESINFERQPLITFENGSGAQLKPVIEGTSIKEVFVLNGGKGYNSSPELVVSGLGQDAKLTPILTGGKIISVKINNGGSGFSTNTTFVDIAPNGQNAKAVAKIRSWNVNQFEQKKNLLNVDDSLIATSNNEHSKGTYVSITAPRALREILYGKNEDGTNAFGANTFDLNKDNGLEVPSLNHSPIIGWANDGHPIYGPYAYNNINGGPIIAVKSGYELDPSNDRPGVFPVGFFVEDYSFKNNGDLDEHNGRFCKTPDFPNGTYAYFATINSGRPNGDGPFKNFKEPTFPYLLGDSYHSVPSEFNFDRKNNQIDFQYNDLFRNTKPTKTSELYGYSEYLNDSTRDSRQESVIEYTNKGGINDYTIVSAGTSYKINDPINLSKEPLFGRGARVSIGRLVGKDIVSIGSSTITSENFELFVGGGLAIGYCTAPHNFENKNRAVISGLSTHSYANLNGTQNITNTQRIWILNEFLDSPTNTGLTTNIHLNGPYDPLYVRENSIIGIGQSAENLEQLKVLNVDPLNSVMRVQRNYNGTVGYAYSSGTIALDIRNKFAFDIGFTTFTSNPPTFQRYFDPSQVVGLGTTSSIVGLGTTIAYQAHNNIAPPHLQENTDYQPGTAYTSRIIPIKTVFIPNHSFNTGDTLTYSNGGGTSVEVSDGIGTFVLSDQSTVYAIKESSNLLGISTTKVGLGSTGSFVGLGSDAIQLAFTVSGVGVQHSFKAETNPITGNANIYEAVLRTKEAHGLTFNDNIRVFSLPNTEKHIFVQYNDYNRRIVFDRKKFEPTGVTSFTNTINVPNHNLNSGDKVIYTTTGNAPVGLSNQSMYYVIVIDSNNLKLAQNKVDAVGSNPTPVSLDSTGSGEHFVSSINPKVNVTRGSIVSFATTDASLSFNISNEKISAFDLDFFEDPKYKNQFITSKESKTFEVQGIGTIGVTTSSAVNLRASESIPDVLYYKFTPINTDVSPTAKTEIFEDTEQSYFNTINVVNSKYRVEEYPTGIGTTEFKFNLDSEPETSSYTSITDGNFYYTHRSLNTTGAIDTLNIKTNNTNYTELPGVTSIGSTTGSGGLVRITGDMGSIVRTRKKSIGYNYPSDPTLKVIANVPEILRIEELNSFASVGISSGGNGYNIEPSLVVIDQITNKKIENVVLQAEVKNGSISKINIRENAKNLSDLVPNIITVNNSNGVGINTVGFNTISKEVTIQFNTGFSTSSSFPFSVGQKVFIEGIGISSEGTGYNSTDYNFKFFEITKVDQNIGGIGSVTYQLDSTVTNPGTYVTTKSSGRIIPFEDFPIFAPNLKKNNFSINEDVVITNVLDSKNGKVSSWDNSNKILKVNSAKEVFVGDTVRGLGSGTTGKVTEKINVDSFYDIVGAEELRLGWQKDTGKPSVNAQRIIDSDYYQYFSYSLKSQIAYDTWNDIVSSMNHTGGFKKFADLQIESRDENFNTTSVSSNEIELLVDIVTQLETYCRYDFDLVSENSKLISGSFLSDEILTRNIPITDFEESIGNRVLKIDNISDQFNNLPRPTRFEIVDIFPISGTRSRKYFILTSDKQFIDSRKMEIVELMIDDDNNGYIQEYAITDGVEDLNGYFDFIISGSEGQLLFYPNDYDTNDFELRGLVYNVDRDIHHAVGISTLVGIHTVGDIVEISSKGSKINPGITTAVNILSIPVSQYDAGHKFQVQMSAGSNYEVLNINSVHNNNLTYGIEYANISNLDGSDGAAISATGSIATFSSYVSGGVYYLNATPQTSVVGTGISFNIFTQQFLGGVSTLGIGTIDFTTGNLQAQYSDIPSAGSPGITTIATFGNSNDKMEAAHILVNIHDVTNDRYELLEGIYMVDSSKIIYESQYGNVEDDDTLQNSGIGTISAIVDGDNYNVVYVAPPLTNVRVKTLITSASETKGGVDELFQLNLSDTKVESFRGSYTNTQANIKRAFELTHDGFDIFGKDFNASDSLVVDTDEDTILLPNHFFTSGERLVYNPTGSGTTSSIGIETTTIAGYGTTDKLPEYVYAIKVDDKIIRLAESPTKALSSKIGDYLNLTTTGIGTDHQFLSQDQNTKCIIAIDNNIQDPVISGNVDHSLIEEMSFGGELMRLSGITSFFGGDLLKVDEEFMKVKQVGFGSTNVLAVQRGWMGTGFSTHSSGSKVEKYAGSYNIVKNTINFYTAPIGVVPIEGTDPNNIDYTGIQTSSTFQGRSFIRSGLVGTSTHTYATNYLFDSISPQLTGVGKTFTLNQDGVNVEGFSTSHGLILINDIAQIPSQGSRINDFEFNENAGITSIVFSGFAASVTNDVNTGSIPVGGIIVSVGSSEGYGYQPLVAAGGTANVNGFGTVTSISIGNSGSGYRSGIATLNGVVRELSYNVGLRTSDIDTVNIVSIGTAIVSNGNVTSVDITNPGTGYTFTNPPIVVFDEPIPYARIPLIYHSDSPGSKIGTNAYIDIKVSQDSSVSDFNIFNSGYGFEAGEIVTVPKGGVTGIPRIAGAGTSEFKINIEKTSSDKFTGWRFGDLDVFDKLDPFFNGESKVFTMKKGEATTSIRAKKGSLIDVEQTILVFLNNILQEPGSAYEFNGGSNITFSEAPKVGDTCSIMFYRGTGGVDVISRDIIETIKPGDTVRINAGDNQNSFAFSQDTRFVSGINTSDAFATSPYQGPGLRTDVTIQRPMTWCKQQEDLFVDGNAVTKNRDLYTARIFPEAHVIKPVGLGSTEIWVDSVAAFDSYPESLRSDLQTVKIINQDPKVGASATAIISGFGTVSSISITNSGLGYTMSPLVSIANSVGLGSATRATAIASITGTAVTSISVSNAGAGYTFSNPPVILLTPPNFDVEEIESVNYAGDYGFISGVSTASPTQLVFDLLIPSNSILRSTAFMGPGAGRTISNIASGYPFVVFDSNIGQGVTSLDLGGSVLGIGTTCLDNVYEAASVSIATTEAVGIGTTHVVKVTVNVDSLNGITGIGYSQFFGRYSWGQLKTFTRSGIAKTFTPALNNGFTGISTGPLILRSLPLKSVGYLT